MFQQRNEQLKKIPGFWATTLTHHVVINQSLTEDDAEILQYCTEVSVPSDKSGSMQLFRDLVSTKWG